MDGRLIEDFEAELARLTAERDRLLQVTLPALENELRTCRADLAAARAELKHISKVWPNVSSGDIHDIDHLLSRLGAGEALEAVREAQEALWSHTTEDRDGESYNNDDVIDALARLKVVFGE